ncbi:MAG: fructose-bisphosphate aldolase [Actinomycetota bacterium]|nr:fructose-bisphosphate aldolase [Actinomycetota bacterium]
MALLLDIASLMLPLLWPEEGTNVLLTTPGLSKWISEVTLCAETANA